MVIRALHFLLLPIAATFGWYMGKKDHPDSFDEASQADTDLALGNFFRRRGEVDRAIRTHQNLLERPGLEKHDYYQTLFALGQDFLKAGVLDRAEKIFLELTTLKEEWGEQRLQSLRFLSRIYQQERDWHKAIEVAKKLKIETGEPTEGLIAQFFCELAEQEMSQGDMNQTWAYLEKATQTESECIRAHLIAARLAHQAGDFSKAIAAYQQVRQQNASFIPEIIEPLSQCYQSIDQEESLIQYLKACLQDYPNFSLALKITDYLQRYQDDQAAIGFIQDYFRQNAQSQGMDQWASLYLDNSKDSSSVKLDLLKNMIQYLQVSKLSYRCQHCGFSMKLLFWCCPSCHDWTTVKPTFCLMYGE